jgi:hypothetical protein
MFVRRFNRTVMISNHIRALLFIIIALSVNAFVAQCNGILCTIAVKDSEQARQQMTHCMFNIHEVDALNENRIYVISAMGMVVGAE